MPSKLKRLILLFCCLWATSVRAEGESDAFYNYQWGRGLTLPALNLNIGGYFKSSYQHPELGGDKLVLDNLSFFITWSPHDRLRFFAEIEQHNWLSTLEVKNFNTSLSVERLFVDFLVNESTTVRFGKYLTPIGRWNVIHSAPLVWTTNRPVITNDLTFAPRANGLLVSHSHLLYEHNLDVSVYLDDSTDLEPKNTHNITFDKGAGARVNYELSETLQVGASYMAFQKLADLGLPAHHLFGIDALWQDNGYEVLFEGLVHTREDDGLDEKGLFVQGVAPLGNKLFAVGRYEYFNTDIFPHSMPDKEAHIGVGGLAWRPYVPLVFKAEYRFGDNNHVVAPSGFFMSIATFY